MSPAAGRATRPLHEKTSGYSGWIFLFTCSPHLCASVSPPCDDSKAKLCSCETLEDLCRCCWGCGTDASAHGSIPGQGLPEQAPCPKPRDTNLPEPRALPHVPASSPEPKTSREVLFLTKEMPDSSPSAGNGLLLQKKRLKPDVRWMETWGRLFCSPSLARHCPRVTS